MSFTSSRPPEPEGSRNSHARSFQNSDFVADPNEKPIMRLMRQKGSYLVGQVQPETTARNQPTNVNANSSLTNLKQFERSLEKQRPPEIEIPSNHINNSFHNSTIKSSGVATPKGQLREKFVSSFMINESTIQNEEDNDIAFNHRVMETQRYGNENLEKIKKLIVDEKSMKSPKSPKKKQQKEPLFSYNATSSTEKLHKSYLKTEEDRRNQYIKKCLADEMREVKPFKIENPMSQFLADKRAEKEGTHKPLYERSIELAKQIEQARLEKQQEAEELRRLKKEEEDREVEQMQRQKLPNATTKERQEQFYNEMIQRERQKNQIKQQQKIEHLKQVTKRKPFVSKASNDLFTKIAEQKEIPKDFVQRNMEYQAERAKQKIRELQKHDEEYCPFKPKISEASREKARQYYEKKEQRGEKSRHENCVHHPQGDQEELQKKLKMIEERMKEKRTPAKGKDEGKHKRASSAANLPMGIKSAGQTSARDNVGKIRNSSNNKDGLTDRKTTDVKQVKEMEIPVYNRSDYLNKRASSCYNLNKK